MDSILNLNIDVLKGIGPRSKDSYALLNIYTVKDLIMYRPRGYEDRSSRVCIGEQVIGGPFTNTIVQVLRKSFFGKALNSVKIEVKDTKNGIRGNLLGFNRKYLYNMVKVGGYYNLYANLIFNKAGNSSRYGFNYSQFEIKELSDKISNPFVPVYSLAGNLNQKTIRKDITNALSLIKYIDNDLPDYMYSKYKLINTDQAVRKMHNPESTEDIVKSRYTLAFSEVFYLQLLALRNVNEKKKTNIKTININSENKNLVDSFINSLQFSLTSDQEKAIKEIISDLDSDIVMNRLLQGDVGAGKTMVAWITALYMIEKGYQVAFMAPTELLAKQHEKNANSLFKNFGIETAFLDSNTKGKKREELLKNISDGKISLIIGTHALFSKDVFYYNLAYVIIDEQHRFGVKQRTALLSKGYNPDVLFMTATPIPRTLALTIYGNLNISTIKTMPSGRKSVKTYLINSEHVEEMYEAIGVEFSRGHKAYFVYPRIEDEEESNLKSVEQMFSELSKRYSNYKGAIVHSKLPNEDKIKILNDFAEKDISFLVATSVVEVGLDVPIATCMVVENAEFFGLSALHQLRGRVGRSTLDSWCFLVYGDNITEEGKRRLSVLRKTNDGFEIAEEDLKIRGPGEISGLKQSGFSNLKYADLEQDLSLIKTVKEEVETILKEDMGLISLRNAVIRNNLSMYNSVSS